MLLVHLQTLAQSKVEETIKFNAQTQLGYEYNYLKSPDKLIINSVLIDAEDLISSSVYQDIDLSFEYNLSWKKSRLKTRVAPNYKAYYKNIKDSYWNIIASSKYNYNITKNTSFLAGFSYRKVIREGFNNDQDVIINPLGYSNYNLNTGIQFLPIKNNKTTTTIFYNLRDFDKYKTRDASLKGIGFSINTEQFIIVANQIHSFGIKTFYKKFTHTTVKQEDQNLNIKRNWTYLKLNPFYQMVINRNFKITPSYNYLSRIDKENQSSFSVLGPELKLIIKQQKTRIILVSSYLTRKYKDIQEQDRNGVEGEKLKFKFISFNLKTEYKFTKKIMLKFSLFSRIRNTNNNNLSSRSYSHFRNQYAEVGLKWEI